MDRWVGSSAFGLPLEVRGLYREMLSAAWRRGASLPNDHEQIRRLIGATLKEWRRTWPLVERYWRVDGNLIVNDTQVAVYTIAAARMKRASDRGQKGAEKRWVSNAQASAQASAQVIASDLRSPSPIVDPTDLHKERCLEILPDEETLAMRAGHLLERYGELFALHRRGARYHSRVHLDFMKAQELVKTWVDDARLEKLAVIVLTSDDDWISRTDRGFGVFAAKATWADDRLTEWEAKQQVGS